MTKVLDWPLEDERQLLANACVPGRSDHSLWNFVRFAAGWHYRAQAREKAGKGLYWLTEDVHKPFIDWLQRQIDEWMQCRRQGKQERFQILAWLLRGFGKTNLVTTCLPAYIMLDDPDLASYIGSETHPKAKEFLTSIKPMLDGTDPHCLFTWFYGNWYHPDRTWTLDALVTAHRHSPSIKEPSIGTFGVETGITGKHPQLLVYDDPISDEKLKEGGNWLTNAITSMDAIHPALTNDSLFVLIGTRYLQSDVIGTALETEGVQSWDGQPPPPGTPFKNDGAWRVYFLAGRDVTDTREYAEGRPVIPKTWSHAAMLAYEAKNPQKYRAQIMGNPMDEKASELTPELIESFFIERKDLPPIEYATIHLDTAFKYDKRKAKGDRNVILVFLHDAAPTGCVNFDGAKIGANWTGTDFDTQLIHTIADLTRRHIRTTTTRVAVQNGHTESIAVGLENRPPAEAIIDALNAFRGRPQELDLPSAPPQPVLYLHERNRPQPALDAEWGRGMTVTVGRLRTCPILDYKFFALGHNTIRGAAGAAILNAELMHKEGLL